jgi:hypothetical protein
MSRWPTDTIRYKLSPQGTRAGGQGRNGSIQKDCQLDGQLAAAHDTLAERAGRIEAFERLSADFERLVSQRDAEAQALHHEIATRCCPAGRLHHLP